MRRIYVFNMTKKKGFSMACGFGVLLVVWIILYFMGCSIAHNMINPASMMDAIISFIILLAIYVIAYCFFYYVIFRNVEK